MASFLDGASVSVSRSVAESEKNATSEAEISAEQSKSSTMTARLIALEYAKANSILGGSRSKGYWV